MRYESRPTRVNLNGALCSHPHSLQGVPWALLTMLKALW